MTDFPTKGEDLKISLRNSNLPQFDYEFALMVKEDHPAIWKTGGNIRGNDAFRLWTKARQGDESPSVLDWIKERESWGARHGGDGSQFPEDSPTKSNISGVVASMKWGVILDIGESLMKEMVRELIEKDEGSEDYRTTKSNTMERRFISTKIESRQDTPETQDEQRVEGYASVFNQSTDIGGFTESIGENAFQDVMNDDVRMLFNHDPNFPLARSRNGEGTLDMKVDENGVFFSFPVGPQTYAKDLHESIKRGDVDEASFAFTVMEDEWEERDGKPHRHITRLGQLIDLSVCTYGAYQQTEVMVRSLPEIPLQENKNNEMETEQKRDRLKWGQSMLELQKLKQQS